MKFSADYRALALDALRGRWKTAILAGLIASLLGANIVSSSDRVISNMSQNANGDTPGFAGCFPPAAAACWRFLWSASLPGQCSPSS